MGQDGSVSSTVAGTNGKTVAVIGGGVAGMSAACALAEAGFIVRLIERRG